MLWIPIALLVVVAVSLLLDLVDLSSNGNRNASLIIRGAGLFVCLISFVEMLTK